MPGLTALPVPMMRRPALAKPLAVTLALACAGALTPALAQTPADVREVDVIADLSAIANPRAATYWAGLEPDLEGAILALLTDRIAEDGVKVEVKLATVELASGFENLADLADTRMSGRVNITSQTDNSAFKSYDLTVSVEEVLPYLPPGTVVSAISLENRDYYGAVVSAFARAVVDRL